MDSKVSELSGVSRFSSRETPRSARLPRRGAITREGTGQGGPGLTTGTAAAPARTVIGRGTRTGAILMPHSFVLIGGLSR
ncbi:hypothetical protein ACFVTC_22855 [Streptomyces sp. NPDC057950]|uniref:hypothetical protein n=1 Tax=Streptomyces sp. NPDC057950 TaxID=3346288 RepID=UPI0036F114AE